MQIFKQKDSAGYNMKILQLVTQRQYRGAEVFAAELSQLLAKNNDVIFAGLYPAPENELEAVNCRNTDLNGTKKFLDLSLLIKLIRLIKKENPDIIQANGSDTLKYAVFAKFRIPHLKIVYRNISMVSSWSSSGSYKRKFNALLFKKVNYVTSVGQQALNDLVKTYHFPVSKTKVIRRGIPELTYDRVAEKTALRKQFGFEENDFVLLHIGRFSPEKNHPFLIDVFRKLKPLLPSLKMIFIGEGPLLDTIKQTTSDVVNDIKYAGHQENVQQYLAGADVFILGSKIEGVPGVVLEAAMQYVPSVAVNVGGVGEVVADHETGCIIEGHDADKFVNAISELANDRNLLHQLGSNAHKLVMENYTLNRCVQQFEELYQQVSKS